jgi:2-iminobutanoate/2-iminopropanoate deaminase
MDGPSRVVIDLDVIREKQLIKQSTGGQSTMVRRMPTHCGDETCPSCVVAGDFIFLAHHAGGFESDGVVVQMEACFDKMKKTLESVGASLDDMVQINLFLRDIGDFRPARDVFHKYLRNGFPARMASTTDFRFVMPLYA